MNNIRIKAQGRTVWNGHKAVELYNVLADSDRFGKDAIMYQGDFDGCVAYIKRDGYDYTREAFEAEKRDVQIANTMWRIIDRDETLLYLRARDGREKTLSIKKLVPVAPDTFTLDDARWYVPYQTATVKIGSKKIW